MNRINKLPLSKLGYGFIEGKSIDGERKDEYVFRNKQFGNSSAHRHLTASEIEALVRNDNTSDDWNNIYVTADFDPQLVKHCHFFGMIRMGKLEPYYLEFHGLKLPVGLYNSTISSCDFGDNVVVHNVNFLSHYILGNEVILFNVNEMVTTDYAKFGNGIIKEGEQEQVRIWLELCNENGGRSILPFEGMLPGDAYLWTRHREDQELMDKFKWFTDQKFDKERGYYGTVGDRTVIKSCKIIKDVKIGSDAYLKGANKLKNLTINSSAEAPSQVGEGCELVNGIIDYGCKIFYGVKAVRFVMASHSQLKYGARLINSYLGNNATISCCEVLNSLIYPSHEQHHNNSFLIAALVMGQSNMAAGATIGSNHNSRGADGEIIAGRGFWPGLSVTLKHNSKFPTFTIIAKGNYMSELNIPFPFSLVSLDEHANELHIMPGYWFMHNMYALARNSWKYVDRDKRTDRTQYIEYDFLAPDSVNELLHAIEWIELSVGKSWEKDKQSDPTYYRKKGKELLEQHPQEVSLMEVYAEGVENSKRKTKLLKVHRSYALFKDLIVYYGIKNILEAIESGLLKDWKSFKKEMDKSALETWDNVGGQLIRVAELDRLRADIKTGKVHNWDEVHAYYKQWTASYGLDKLHHAMASLLKVQELTTDQYTSDYFVSNLNQSVETLKWMKDGISDSRAKDYNNAFRRITYNNEDEMNAVVGKLSDNSFIRQTAEAYEVYVKKAKQLMSDWHLK